MILVSLASAHVPFHRGDVVITELDARPAADGGQWFEVVNTTAGTLNLVEQVYTDADGDTFQVELTLLVRAGESAIFASTDSTVAPDYPLPDGFDLRSDAGAVIHTDLTGVIDEVWWDSTWGLSTLQLDASLIGEFPNDLRRNWCALDATPRAANLPCPGSDTDDDGDGWSEATGDCDDDNSGIHPGAYDAADVSDDADCDGERDEDPPLGDTGDTGAPPDTADTADTSATPDTADTARSETASVDTAPPDSAGAPTPTPPERVCAGWLVMLLPLGALRSRRRQHTP